MYYKKSSILRVALLAYTCSVMASAVAVSAGLTDLYFGPKLVRLYTSKHSLWNWKRISSFSRTEKA